MIDLLHSCRSTIHWIQVQLQGLVIRSIQLFKNNSKLLDYSLLDYPFLKTGRVGYLNNLSVALLRNVSYLTSVLKFD